MRTTVLGASGLALAACGGNSSRNQAYRVDRISYGPDPNQVAELNLALLPSRRPVAVLVHGGYWRGGFTRSEMDDLSQDLARLGYATWNLDYRRVGDPGGGWPGTFTDVATAVDMLADLAPGNNLDLTRVVFIGHSAGATLALWAASRGRARPGQPGGPAKVTPKAVVSLSGVVDLVASAQSTAGGNAPELRDATIALMGGTPTSVPDRYAAASPLALLPLGLPQLLLHGSKDDRVPIEQSRAYVSTAAKASDNAKLIEQPNADHFDVVRSNKASWDAVVGWLATNVGDPLA